VRQTLEAPIISPDGGTYSSPQAVTVSVASSVSVISSVGLGTSHALAVMSDGKVYGWGSNENGQAGLPGPHNAGSYSTLPAVVNGIDSVKAVAGGNFHSLALKTDGTVWAWGRNDFGESGTGMNTTNVPAQVIGLNDVAAIAANGSHSLALRNDGTVWAWGYNQYGALGDGTTVLRSTPVQVLGLTNVKAIAAGSEHNIALKNDGTVWTWGLNGMGQIGDGTLTTRLSPVQVTTLTNVVSVAAGYEHTVAVRNDGTVWSWGDNQYGEIGDGTNTSKFVPTQTTGLTGVSMVAAAGQTTVALRNDGSVWTWGQNSNGQLGTGYPPYSRMEPAQVGGLSNISVIAVGFANVGALGSNGQLWRWGSNMRGELGDGSTFQRHNPVQLNFFSSGPSIHYTVNGLEPTDDDPVINSGGTILVDKNMTLRAKVFREGFAPSSVKSGSYVINGGPAWEAVTLTAGQTEIKTWLYQGRTYVYLKLLFPNAGYRVTDWGQVVRLGNDFSSDASVERYTGTSVQAVKTTAQIYDLGPLAPGNYNFIFKNSGSAVKTLAFTVSGNSPEPNPIDDQRQFVRQQYLDFLHREPDAPGWDHWTGEITQCTTDPSKRLPGESEAQCIVRKRANTSAAFFLSPEFQNTGYFVLRVYRGSLGRMPYFGGSVPADNTKDEFTRDHAAVSAGIVVNNQLDQTVMYANKQAFVNQFVTRADFLSIYGGLDDEHYVDKLFETTNVVPTSNERQALINGLSGGNETRASVLFKIVDGRIEDGSLVLQTRYGKLFYDQQQNPGFVQMEYFGYMKRDPDDAGYAFWLAKLNQYGGNFVDAQMVLAFISSPEYRARFGQP
jgi:alpha-tubulin suppressor-like RCC1 family protein